MRICVAARITDRACRRLAGAVYSFHWIRVERFTFKFMQQIAQKNISSFIVQNIPMSL